MTTTTSHAPDAPVIRLANVKASTIADAGPVIRLAHVVATTASPAPPQDRAN